MQTARDDRAGKFICHGLRRFIIGGRLNLVDINAVAVTLGVDDARGKRGVTTVSSSTPASCA